MKSLSRTSRLAMVIAVVLWGQSAAQAVIFTTNASITFNDTSLDGQDIVVIGSTLTVDGSHSFSDVLLVGGATLTHSFSPGDVLQSPVQITGEQQTLTGTNANTLDETNVNTASIGVMDITGTIFYQPGVDYVITAGTDDTTQIARLPVSAIADGQTVTVNYTTGLLVLAGLNLTVTNNVVIDATSAINANGKGFGAGMGPGFGLSRSTNHPYFYTAGGGGAYGGYGGSSSSLAAGGNAYGTFLSPTNAGSGGGAGTGSGGSGGGTIQITAGGALWVDGQIVANGANATNTGAGGGAGGGISLAAQSFGGAGMISADGGAGDPFLGGGGGGGLVSVAYAIGGYTGAIAASGGAGAQAGGAGTICTQLGTNSAQSPGAILVDNAGAKGTNSLLGSVSGTYDLTITGGAKAVPVGSLPTIRNLVINSNSFLASSTPAALILQVTSNATIAPGGGIVVDGDGYSASQGPGAGLPIYKSPYFSGTGGGHGGYGGASGNGSGGGNSYDSTTQPNQGGSGGGNATGQGGAGGVGGAGGGVLRMSVTGVLNLGGSISANGLNGTGEGSGGGAGGAIWVTAGQLGGGGTLSANGGAGQPGAVSAGGGAGGRIAVYAGTNSFTGSESARGGPGFVAGGAGTIYLLLTNEGVAQWIVDNGGLQGTNTPLSGVTGIVDLTVANGAIALELQTLQTLHNLLITSNSFLTVSAPLTSEEEVTVTGNATIQQGGGIFLMGTGFAAGLGSGAGHTSLTNGFTIGCGGGNGGYGGGAGGGQTYGSATFPNMPGSGGGNGIGTPPFNAGGAGGAALSLNVTGTLLLGGSINANGGDGIAESSGGGSGGSVYVSAGMISGTGSISANGGAGLLSYGGGGGGRIALAPHTNNFTGSLSAHGGPGLFPGGAGTVYIQATGTTFPQFIVDNGGLTGANTPMPSLPGLEDIIITNGAVLTSGSTFMSSLTIHSLSIGSNSFFSPSGPFYYFSQATVTATGSVTIQPGGGIVLDGAAGLTQGQGQGGSIFANGLTTGGGGGHGGYGGSSSGGAAGGSSYDPLTSPSQGGSRGGNGTGTSPFNLGGVGGGALRLMVTGVLSVGGSISANGLTGPGQGSGGGSGGSVWLSAGTLAGDGTISANGGPGEPTLGGGGGGGGRIAVSAPTNQFTGTMTAHGGSGFVAGGPGTIYSSLGRESIAQIIIDNGGLRGATNTALGGTSFADVTISGGAGVSLASLPQSIHNLLIASNSLLTQPVNGQLAGLLQPTVTGNATIQAGGAILLDGLGYGAGNGPGAGRDSSGAYGLQGGGGGHGGFGGNDLGGGDGGNYYDSITQPATPGSGGGGGGVSGRAGAGGSAIHLTVTGTLSVDGTISANGTTASLEGAGGGSGGAIWLTAGTFKGAGLISANGGGASLPFGGGGAGGRIAIYPRTNSFAGSYSATGGPGFMAGGAGTVYIQNTSAPVGSPGSSQLFVDNGGLEGTNTPVSPPSEVALTISGGAVVQPVSSFFSVGSLVINPGAEFTDPNPQGLQGQLTVMVLSNALVQSNAEISLDGQGSLAGTGLGQGTMPSNGNGSGGGYGGAGGASGSGAPGGTTYGSNTEPTGLGSGGGVPAGLLVSGLSQGGGALNLTVGGTLTVNGSVSANGNDGELDTGGGSGGSLWLTVGTLAGNGVVSTDGGNAGDGGGGGGGRIAVYYRTNNFSGLLLANGGGGANPGQNGTEYLSATLPALQVSSQSPAGVVTYPVNTVSLTLNAPADDSSLSSADVSVTAPGGPVSLDDVSVTAPTPGTLTLSFPAQNAVGDYQIQVSAQSMFGIPMTTPYTGTFTIAAPVISGVVTAANGQPAAGVAVQAGSGVEPATTDAGGNYALAVPPGWSGYIAPSQPGAACIPSCCAYTNVPTMPATQNFVLVPQTALAMADTQQGGSLNLSWFGASGATYQVQCSTNLVDWTPYGAPVTGGNAMINVTAPVATSGQMFFRFNAAPAQ